MLSATGKGGFVVRKQEMVKLESSEYLTVSEVAHKLNMSASGIRHYANKGLISAIRHPINGYRLFREVDVNSLLRVFGEAERGIEMKREGKRV